MIFSHILFRLIVKSKYNTVTKMEYFTINQYNILRFTNAKREKIVILFCRDQNSECREKNQLIIDIQYKRKISKLFKKFCLTQ